MSNPDELFDEVHALILAGNERALTDDEHAQLEELVCDNAAARKIYVRHVLQTASLRSWACGEELSAVSDRRAGVEEATEPAEARHAADRLGRGEAGRGSKNNREGEGDSIGASHRPKSLLQRASRHPRGPAIAIAVAVMLMVIGAMAITPVSEWIAGDAKPIEKDAKPAEDAEHVAILNDWRDAKWLEGTRPPLNNPRLFVGKRLVIESGLIEVKYLTGARVVIEGPAEFTIGTEAGGTKAQSEGGAKNSANSGYLKLGSLVARVEGEDAKGFTIDSPSMRVRDLGTEFGIDVRQDGSAEIVVVDGEVDLIPIGNSSGDDRVLLVANQGAFVDAGGKIARRDDVDDRFVALIKQRLRLEAAADAAGSDRERIIAAANFEGRIAQGNTATNVSWVVDGIREPGDLTCVEEDNDGRKELQGLFNTFGASDFFAPKLNLGTQSPWSVTLPMTPTRDDVVLDQLVIDYQHFDRNGVYQPTTALRGTAWVLEIRDPQSNLLGRAEMTDPGNKRHRGRIVLELSSPIALERSITYEAKLLVSSSDGLGNHSSIKRLWLLRKQQPVTAHSDADNAR